MGTGRFSRLLTLPAARAAALVLGLSASSVASATVPVCLDYHCDRTQAVLLDAETWLELRGLFAGVADADAERAAIRAAIALFERRVGALTGTWRDLAGNRAGAGEPGQLDCIAESRNTTTYLELLAEHGLLRFHRVEPRVERLRWLVMAHWTAVVRDLKTDRAYAVDSWFLDNGQPPYIQPLESWLRGEDLVHGP
jgi:hypothetical protein